MQSLPDIFDAIESDRLKHEGMKRAAGARSPLLDIARDRARRLAAMQGSVTMDDVTQQLLKEGFDIALLGPAAGSVFVPSEWEFTGQFIKSARVSNHSRLLRVWRRKENAQ